MNSAIINYDAAGWISALSMQRHPEGGWYAPSYSSATSISVPERQAERKLWTSIYFLIESGDASHLHRLRSDEMWYFHAGSPLSVCQISPEGSLSVHRLGLDIAGGERPQLLVPAGCIFGSFMDEGSYSLVGCMVSPGFEFADFELFDRAELLEQYPQHDSLIKRLTR